MHCGLSGQAPPPVLSSACQLHLLPSTATARVMSTYCRRPYFCTRLPCSAKTKGALTHRLALIPQPIQPFTSHNATLCLHHHCRTQLGETGWTSPWDEFWCVPQNLPCWSLSLGGRSTSTALSPCPRCGHGRSPCTSTLVDTLSSAHWLCCSSAPIYVSRVSLISPYRTLSPPHSDAFPSSPQGGSTHNATSKKGYLVPYQKCYVNI